MLKEKSECVKVVVRCRPLADKEMNDGNKCVIEVDSKLGSIRVTNPTNAKDLRIFTYDYTYDWKSTQELIFSQTAQPILESVMEGYNGTIFAYGQTGTGKTFTMEGVPTPELKGITPRTIDWIFNNIKNYSNQQFLVRVSFVEIYNEEVRDLLSKNVKNKLNIREKEGAFYIEDCKVIQVENAQQMMGIMMAGRDNRSTGATKMNAGSSRSHSIFSIIIENSSIDSTGETHYRMGKLNLVDLAGSERQSKTEATGERFKEATKINLSLTVLGNVINKLVSNKSQHIPFRESKLTMLLQDSLGGNTKTVMIANVGPADYNYEETLNTLWYASNAKKIKNKPKINEDPKDALLRQYQDEIEILKKQLSGMGKGLGISMSINPTTKGEGINYVEDDAAMKQAVDNLEKEKEDFRTKHEDEIKKVKELKNMAEEEKNKIVEKLNKEISDQKKVKDEAKNLLMKYREMKKTVLKGNITEQKVKEQESEIKKKKEELEIKRKEEQRLHDELQAQNKKNVELKKKYETSQANIDDLNDKIGVLRQKIEEIKSENKDNGERLSRELSNLQDDIKNIQIENMRKEFIINTFIAPEERDKISQCIQFNEKEQIYIINRILAIKNNYKTNRDVLKNMRKNKISLVYKNEPNLDEQIINLKLEMPEKLIINFKGEQNDQVIKEIQHVLKDDDSDLFYYDKELNLVDNNLTGSIIKNNSSRLSTPASTNSNSSTTNNSIIIEPVNKKNKIRLPSAKIK